MIRLKDVSAVTGVSTMTVSKALRDRPDVAPATKNRIRRVARELGYVPNVTAQQLRTGRTQLFGLVISSATNPINARLSMAIEENAHELGFDVLLAQTLNRADREDAVLHRLIRRRVDGIFISPVYRMESKAPVYDELARAKIPVVLLGHRAPFCEYFTAVETDDFHASAETTQHLVGLGHRRIAFFAGSLVSPAAQEKLAGYRRALRDAGISEEDSLVFNAGTTIEEGAATALQFLSEQTGATALQCSHDLVAIGAANTLLNQGFRIPADLSVTGFGNILAAEHFRVPLTTVRQPKLRLGAVAMEAMLKLLRGESPFLQRLAAPLEVRSSSGPAPAPSHTLLRNSSTSNS